MTALFYEDITAFMELIRKQRFDEAEKEMKRKRREVEQAKKQIVELDRIFKRIYEDDISGAISHERFLKLSAEYEAEQKELTEKVNGKRYQKVDIVFNFVGELHFPTDPQTERTEQQEQEKTA